ncbi:MCE family protein [Mycolicibacterium helvum]|uniref:Mce family protein Mce3C n=1 Tax=Mycolicibacterium helvum TaxID=1534349 RepID=A0A7I7T903_9MYCO|nr:MCE family protein [Mycolicibacterium helvum]BBY64971.1 Mce family protein Mce3C [Mycolicibacterium helvum]
MKALSQRNPLVVGVVGIVVIGVIATGVLQYKKLPFLSNGRHYSAYFADASGLRPGAAVQIAGYQVGEVSAVELDGSRVAIDFTVEKGIRLGELTEAAVKTKTLLGAKILEVTPRGDGVLTGLISAQRTTPAYQLPDALGDLAHTVDALNTGQLNDALTTLAETFRDSPPDLRRAVDGVARFSRTLGERDAQLRHLLENARKSTAVLAQRTDQIVGLITQSNAFLAQLREQSAALDQVSENIVAVTAQLSGVISDNKAELGPALDKVNGVLAILDGRKAEIRQVITMLHRYAMSLGESVASGPFFKAYLVNLLPGQFLQPFIDAAFSDLGLDPKVLAPSELNDPQVGQPGTPALPVPFPRTGQGGEPRLTVPDAITGKPGDPRYPYREPIPAPTPGGPPPGPPAPGPGVTEPAS